MKTEQEIPAHIERPLLRNLEITQEQSEEGQPVFCISDPSGLVEKVAVVPPAMIELLRYFDGQHTLRDIQAEIMKAHGELVPLEDITSVVKQLDAVFFLEGETFRAFVAKIRAQYEELRVRPAYFAENAYPSDPAELISQFDSFFDHKNDRIIRRSSGKSDTPSAIIAPHVSIGLGANIYASAYREIIESEPADVYIILGTGHRPIENFFAATKKSFETPLGILETDKQFLSRLESETKFDIYAGELAHISEHTVEFQAVMLKYALGEKSAKIVPVLCSFPYHIPAGRDIFGGAINMRLAKSRIDEFNRALQKTISGYDGSVCIIASVDFSHLGMNYGDSSQPKTQEIAEMERLDRELLSTLSDGDAGTFVNALAADDNSRRICGFAPIYTMLSASPDMKGEVMGYGYCDIDSAGSIVSYAGMTFRKKN